MQGKRYSKSETKQKKPTKQTNIQKKTPKPTIQRKTREYSIVTDVQMGIWDWHKLNSKTNKGSGDEFPE